mmetsp:Transcript_12609/g.14027  ORF Transcript_12609/g.14027 Transcript_12609/m.14027 type:complete len:112 (+) Transcript_12609:266-601(+)
MAEKNGGEVVRGEGAGYIVTINKAAVQQSGVGGYGTYDMGTLSAFMSSLSEELDGDITVQNTYAATGMALIGDLNDKDLAKLAANKDVSHVEPNMVIKLDPNEAGKKTKSK